MLYKKGLKNSENSNSEIYVVQAQTWLPVMLNTAMAGTSDMAQLWKKNGGTQKPDWLHDLQTQKY